MNNTTRFLVIGNGYDLAHGLPTKYTDFLYSLHLLHKKHYPRFSRSIPEIDNAPKEVINKLYSEWLYRPDQIRCYYNNSFISHFYDRLELNGWIDFESVIAGIVTHCDKQNKPKIESSDKFILYSDDGKIFSTIEAPYPTESLQIQPLEFALNELIECLDLYLRHHVGKVIKKMDCGDTSKARNHFLYDQPIDRVISFNYTFTFGQLTNKPGSPPIPIEYIHGRCSNDETPQNMVLGIEDAEPTNLHKVAFKKWFQRMQKHTTLDYRTHVDDALKNGGELSVDIFGHSLDITDHDVLMYLFTHATQTKIYYMDQKDYEQKVVNLYKLFNSQRDLEEYYYGKKIIFEKITY